MLGTKKCTDSTSSSPAEWTLENVEKRWLLPSAEVSVPDRGRISIDLSLALSIDSVTIKVGDQELAAPLSSLSLHLYSCWGGSISTFKGVERARADREGTVWPDLTNGDGLRDKAKFLLDWDRKGGGSGAGEVGAS